MVEPMRLIIGASSQFYPGWIQTQQEELDLVLRSDWEKFAPIGGVQAILAEHVWEHLSPEDALVAARNCFEFLVPGGYVRCAVPDGLFPNPDYQRLVQVGGPGSVDHPAAGHKIVYDYRTLTAVFRAAGFEVHLLEWWNEEGTFSTHPWDERDGFIYRSARFDHRNQSGVLGFTSLIIDAIKP